MSRLFHARTLFILCALFIFYATTIPWDMSHAPALSRVHWIPGWDSERGRIWSIPDMVQNVVLFMPYGFFAYLGFEGIRNKGPAAGALICGLLGFALSLLVEILQTMSSTRNAATTDLVTNFSGALAGGIAGAIYVSLLKERIDLWLTRTVRDRPGLIILGAYFIAITAGALAPFIPTLDVGLLRHNARLFLDDPWGVKPFGALITDGLLFAALAFLAAFELPSYLKLGERPPLVKAGIAVCTVSLLAVVLEMGQTVIIGHSPGVQDMVVGIAGALIGGALAVMVGGELKPARELGALTRRVPILIIGFALLAPLCRALQPFQIYDDFSEGLVDVTAWNFVPFWQLFRNINLSTFRNVFEAAAIYLPLGYAIHALGYSSRIGFLVCLGWAEVLEILQIPIVDRTLDITEGIYAGLMGLLGAYALIHLRNRRE